MRLTILIDEQQEYLKKKDKNENYGKLFLLLIKILFLKTVQLSMWNKNLLERSVADNAYFEVFSKTETYLQE